ncbi:hypothetical protein BH09PSE6_BH09PSE6_07220 [soil metagenome]
MKLESIVHGQGHMLVVVHHSVRDQFEHQEVIAFVLRDGVPDAITAGGRHLHNTCGKYSAAIVQPSGDLITDAHGKTHRSIDEFVRAVRSNLELL